MGTLVTAGLLGRWGLRGHVSHLDGARSVAFGEPGPACPVTARPVAEMMPSVTLPVRPSGVPTASTMSPTLACRAAETRWLEARGVLGAQHGEIVRAVAAGHPRGAETILSHFVRSGDLSAGGVMHAVTSAAQTPAYAGTAHEMEARRCRA